MVRPPKFLSEMLAGFKYIASGLWTWAAIAVLSPLIYGAGISAMYGAQYFLAACFYLVAVILLGSKTATSLKTSDRKLGFYAAIAFASFVLCGLSLLWLKHTYEANSPAPAIIALLINWWTSGIALMRNWPWIWIGASILFGIAIGGGLISLGRRHSPYQWLHSLADSQLNRISDLVELKKPWVKELNLIGNVPHVTFVLPVHSEALFGVTINRNVSGKILFDNQELGDLRLVKSTGDEMPYKGDRDLVIEQRLTEREAKMIASSEARFHFNELNVTIDGPSDTAFSRIPASGRLRITREHSVPVREMDQNNAAEVLIALSAALANARCLKDHFPVQQGAGDNDPGTHLLNVWLAHTTNPINSFLGPHEVIKLQGGKEPPVYPTTREGKLQWLDQRIDYIQALIKAVRVRSRMSP